MWRCRELDGLTGRIGRNIKLGSVHEVVYFSVDALLFDLGQAGIEKTGDAWDAAGGVEFGVEKDAIATVIA